MALFLFLDSVRMGGFLLYLNANNTAEYVKTLQQHFPAFRIPGLTEVQLTQFELYEGVLLALHKLIELENVLGLLVGVDSLAGFAPVGVHVSLLVVVVGQFKVHGVATAELNHVGHAQPRVLLHLWVVL